MAVDTWHCRAKDETHNRQTSGGAGGQFVGAVFQHLLGVFASYCLTSSCFICITFVRSAFADHHVVANRLWHDLGFKLLYRQFLHAVGGVAGSVAGSAASFATPTPSVVLSLIF